MAAFNLADVLKSVSSLDTGVQPEGREQIEYIDIGLIDPDPNNFYELSGLDELAANIELLGLQQPLRVRPNPEQPGRWIIVSGHRRRAALEMLAAEGKAQFAQAPCIREADSGSAALQELRLIYANSDTRKLTSAEISKQAERVEALLYQLKEEGMDFPGRMRDHVAEACQISKSKLARLKVIREHLEPVFSAAYEAGKLPETVAYALAKQPAEIQRAVYDYKQIAKYGAESLREWHVEDVAKNVQNIVKQDCPLGGKCRHGTALLGKIYDNVCNYKSCSYVKCCDKCDLLASCKTACPELKVKIDKLKADKKETARAEAAAKAERDRPEIEQIAKLWARFSEARKAAGKTIPDVMQAAHIYANSNALTAIESGTVKIRPETNLPYGYSFDLQDSRALISIADFLGCSLDYLLCRTDDPGPRLDTGKPTWRQGTPEASGNYWVRCVNDEETDWDVNAYFDSVTGRWFWPGIGNVEPEWSVTAWYPLPED